jgi:hypothetical protein
VHACLDDLVIALYVTIDELLEPRRGPGRPPKLSDAELICLAVAQVLLGYRSERRWLRAVTDRLGHLFPYVAARPPTTAACAGPRHCRRDPAHLGHLLPRRGATSGGCWMPPQSPAAPPARPCGAASWPAGPAMAGPQPQPLVLGRQAVCAGLPGRHGSGLVPCQPRPRRT